MLDLTWSPFSKHVTCSFLLLSSSAWVHEPNVSEYLVLACIILVSNQIKTVAVHSLCRARCAIWTGQKQYPKKDRIEVVCCRSAPRSQSQGHIRPGERKHVRRCNLIIPSVICNRDTRKARVFAVPCPRARGTGSHRRNILGMSMSSRAREDRENREKREVRLRDLVVGSSRTPSAPATNRLALSDHVKLKAPAAEKVRRSSGHAPDGAGNLRW